MTHSTDSLLQRLRRVESPRSCMDWEKKEDGYYISMCRVSREDVPALIDVALKWADPDWPFDDFEGDEEELDAAALTAVTAWRALADLRAAESVEPLIRMLAEFDDLEDDWSAEELPSVFAKIGEPAIDPLFGLVNDTGAIENSRLIAIESLRRVAEARAETRHRIVARLTDIMVKATDDCIHFNSTVMAALVALRAVEAAEATERAFARNLVDVGMIGDWECVRRELGVEGLGLEMPQDPYNSIESFRHRTGIGIFSSRPLYYVDGSINSDAEQAYYEKAWQAFSASAEAQQAVDLFGDLNWFRMLLEFGMQYLAETVDVMSLSSVHEFVLEHIPRKVSVQPDRAAAIVFELTRFWQFLNRVYELPAAKSIVEWLETDGLIPELKAELSDPANYGMAKSFFMAGSQAGYDMTSKDSLEQFTEDYNQAQLARRMSVPGGKQGQQRIRRNDPCPCGSGKKFKKCCR